MTPKKRISPRGDRLVRLAVGALVALLAGGGQLATAATAGATNVILTTASPPASFSPNGDGQEDTFSGYAYVASQADVTVTVVNSASVVVRTLQPATTYSGNYDSFSWDGTNDAAGGVSDGAYKIHFSAHPPAGSDETLDIATTVDRRLPGRVTTPATGATISGNNLTLKMTPTSGFSGIYQSTFCDTSYGCYGSATAATSGVWQFGADLTATPPGADGFYDYVYWTDSYSTNHSYYTPQVAATVAHPVIIGGQTGSTSFSPNGDGQEDVYNGYFYVNGSSTDTVVVKDPSSAVVRTVTAAVATSGAGYRYFTWDGTRDDTTNAPQGTYTVAISAQGTYGSPATTTIPVFLDRHVPGTITSPASGANLSTTTSVVFTPQAGFPETTTQVVFYDTSHGYLGAATTPNPDGTWSASFDFSTVPPGPDTIYAYAYFTDPYGNGHTYQPPTVAVNVVGPVSISGTTGSTSISPDGDGQNDAYNGYFYVNGSSTDTVVVKDSTGATVRTLTSAVATSGAGYRYFTWDGARDDTTVVPEGTYTVHITAQGAVGAAATTDIPVFVDRHIPGTVTAPTNGSTVTGPTNVVFTPQAGFPETTTQVNFYDTSVGYLGAATAANPDGTWSVSHDFSGNPPGADTIYAYAYYTNPFGGQQSYTTNQPAVTVASAVTVTSVTGSTSFSPNGDGQEDTYSGYFYVNGPSTDTVVVKKSTGTVVKTLLSSVASPGAGYRYFTWDGNNTAGAPQPTGNYTIAITAQGGSGPAATSTIPVFLDRLAPGSVTSPTANASLYGSTSFVFSPTALYPETITSVAFYLGGYNLGTATTANPDGTWHLTYNVGAIPEGPSTVQAYAAFTDPYGGGHSYAAPAVPVTVTHTAPTITVTSASPALGQGASGATVTITGSGFVAPASVNFGGTGVSVKSGTTPTVVSATKITVKVNVATTAPTGGHDVTVASNGATVTCSGCLTVNPGPVPSLVNPNKLQTGAVYQTVTLTGSNFFPKSKVAFAGGGITAKVVYVNPTTLSLKVTVAQTAKLGARDITVTNPDFGVGVCSKCFTVLAGPTVSTVSPAGQAHGTTQSVTVTGTHFDPAASLVIGSAPTATAPAANAAGVSVSAVSVSPDGTTLTATVTLAGTTVAGSYSVTVVNPASAGAGEGTWTGGHFTVT